MTWRRLTAVIIGACILIPAGTFLRDVNGSRLPPSAPSQAQLDGGRLLSMIAPSESCANLCAVDVLGMTSANTWRVQLTAPSWRRCFLINLSTFEYSDQRGVSGLKSAPCGA
jgi:hypothetical protein